MAFPVCVGEDTEMSLKTEYETMNFHKSGNQWLGYIKRERTALGVWISMQDFEWRAANTFRLSGKEHRDIADFLDQLNKEGKA